MPSRASTDIDVASRALVMIGTKPITSFQDGTTEANAASIIYEDVVTSVMTLTTWRFTIKQRELNRIDEDPIGRWDQVWQIPADCLQIRAVTSDNTRILFERYQDRIYTRNMGENAVLVVDYAQRVGTADWPPYFTVCVIHALASELAIAIAQNEAMAKLHTEKYSMLSRIGKSVDAQGRTNSIMDTRMYDRARS